MKQIIGLIFIVLGVVTMIFGPIGITIYSLYDIIVNWETLSKWDIFMDIVFFAVKDFMSIVVGLLLYFIGMIARGE